MKNAQILLIVVILVMVTLIHLPICSKSNNDRYKIINGSRDMVLLNSTTGETWRLGRDDSQGRYWEEIKIVTAFDPDAYLASKKGQKPQWPKRLDEIADPTKKNRLSGLLQSEKNLSLDEMATTPKKTYTTEEVFGTQPNSEEHP